MLVALEHPKQKKNDPVRLCSTLLPSPEDEHFDFLHIFTGNLAQIVPWKYAL